MIKIRTLILCASVTQTLHQDTEVMIGGCWALGEGGGESVLSMEFKSYKTKRALEMDGDYLCTTV